MTESRSESRIDRESVATMLRLAGIPVEEDRLDELAGLLEAAGEAACHLDSAAPRVPLAEALAVFDPAWTDGER